MAENGFKYFEERWDGEYIFDAEALSRAIWDELGGPYAGMEFPYHKALTPEGQAEFRALTPHRAVAALFGELTRMVEYGRDTAEAEGREGYAPGREWSELGSAVYFTARMAHYLSELTGEMTRVGVLPD